MTSTDADFINRDTIEMAKLRTFEPFAQMPFEDIFNCVPADLQMVGHILDCHMAAQCDDIVFKGPGVESTPIGKT